jgi:hypothetical protein
MKTQWQWCGRALAAASLSLFALTTVQAQDAPAAGVLWETTAQTEIPGMPMKLPAFKGEVCQKPEWTQPPPSSDKSQNCKNTSFNRDGNKVTWTVACENPPMTGDGEITFEGTEAYSGVILLRAEGMSMTINLTGKKLGTCDNPE